MKQVKIGVMGAYRGSSMIHFCKQQDKAKIVAICDKWVEGLERQKAKLNDPDITYYTDFEEFIKHDMDAVVLANYANEHAPFAIRAMKAGKHVYSEVLPCQTMSEAVELIETIEQTGKIYAYGENYCYMPSTYEMRQLYRSGILGEFEYAEGEYIHNCAPIWHAIAYGDPNHWRNRMYSTFYCTHSLGPIVHITGERPVSVIGIEGTKNQRALAVGLPSGAFGIEMVTFENGGIAKSIHGGLYKNSIWYTLYGSKGRVESAREDAKQDAYTRVFVNRDEVEGDDSTCKYENYLPKRDQDAAAVSFGHGNSDFYALYHFVEKLLGNPEADTIDIYEALDMFLPGMFAYRSILKGGIPMEIPNLRDPAVRELYRNDRYCTDPKLAGDQLLPLFSKGDCKIDPKVYEIQKQKWIEEQQSGNYIKQVMKS